MKTNLNKDPQKRGEERINSIRLTPEEERRVQEWRDRRARRQRPGGRTLVLGETNRYGNREISDHEQNEYGWSEYPGQPFSSGVGEETYRPEPDEWMQSGPHTGKGPKGYERPDNRIFEDVCERLTNHGQIDARNITVEVVKGEVTLRGTVDTRRTKRMVEDTIDNVTGIRDIHNELHIASDETNRQS